MLDWVIHMLNSGRHEIASCSTTELRGIYLNVVEEDPIGAEEDLSQCSSGGSYLAEGDESTVEEDLSQRRTDPFDQRRFSLPPQLPRPLGKNGRAFAVTCCGLIWGKS